MVNPKINGQYLEDYAVGQVYRSGRLRVDKDQIIAFAAQFDPQPYHLDEEAARKSFFGGLAASGWHLWWKANSDRQTVSLELVSRSLAGRVWFAPAMSCTRRAKCSKCAYPNRVLIEV